jgi:hypothetical protein
VATRKVKLLIHRHTAAEWAASTEVLMEGQPGWSTDTHVLKIGDGVSLWTDLPAITGGTSGTTDHAALTHLTYGDSGHTGFAPTVHTHAAQIVPVPHCAHAQEINYTGSWRVLKQWDMSDFHSVDYVVAVCRVTSGRAADGEWKVRVTATGIGGAPDLTWDVTMAAGVKVGSNTMAASVAVVSYHVFTISACLSGDIGDINPQDVDIELVSR